MANKNIKYLNIHAEKHVAKLFKISLISRLRRNQISVSSLRTMPVYVYLWSEVIFPLAEWIINCEGLLQYIESFTMGYRVIIPFSFSVLHDVEGCLQHVKFPRCVHNMGRPLQVQTSKGKKGKNRTFWT